MNLIDRILHRISRIPIFFPPDVYERHRFVAAYIRPEDTVLDVGGELGQLKKFARAKKIVVADINRGDIQFDGKKLPLKNRSFDIVSAIDVLEHVSPKARLAFIRELWRVADKMLILSVPLGTKAHSQAEREELARLHEQKKHVSYLEEHVKYGLPTLEEVKQWAPQSNGSFYFVGDFRWSRLLFRWHTFQTGNGFLDRVVFLDKLFDYFFLNLFLYPLMIRLPKHERTNRLYVIWRKR